MVEVLRGRAGLHASGIADSVERAAAERRSGALRDDLAILVLRVRP